MPDVLVSSRGVMVTKKPLKMGRDFGFINSRIEHALCAKHGKAYSNYSGKHNMHTAPAWMRCIGSR